MRITRNVAAALALLLGAGTAAASEAPVAIGGFVDASYAGNLDLHSDAFGLDQVELDLTRDLEGKGGLRADLEWVKDGDDWAVAVEQGYLELLLPAGTDTRFTLGRFNAPIGFELLDAPDMYQFSHALVFDHGLPSNLTGAMVATALGERADLRAYLVDGWDVNDLGAPGPKTVGGRLGIALGELGGLGVSGIAGVTADSVNTDRQVLDVDLTLTPSSTLLVGAEFNHGHLDMDGATADWNGLLVMAHLTLNDWLGLTARYDWFDDPDGAVFGLTGGETRQAITLAPTFALGEGMGALVELRVDSSSEDVFTNADGEAKGSTTSVAFEMTFGF